MKILNRIRRNRVIAVIRAPNPQKALELAEACIHGGFQLIEITFSIPKAETVISELRRNKDIVIGAGTVLDIEMAKTAANSGANFIISPHTDKDIISYAKSRKLFVASGASTSSEMMNAWNLGADMVKIFPIMSFGGPSYIKALKEPLPFIEIMATGGVTIENFTDLLNAGATLVGFSSALIGREKLFDYNTTYRVSEDVIRILASFERELN